MYHILSFLPRSAGTANALVGVCKGWREAILTDDAYLGSLNFSLVASQPFKGMETVRGAVAHRRTWAYADRHARAIDGAASTTTKTTGGFEPGGGFEAFLGNLTRLQPDQADIHYRPMSRQCGMQCGTATATSRQPTLASWSRRPKSTIPS